MGIDGRRVRVVVADDSAVIRGQLRDRLEAEPDLDVVGTGWSGMEALRLVHQLEPDVLVLDQDMTDLRGAEVAAHLGVAGMEIRVVLYTIDEGDRRLRTDAPGETCLLDDASVGALVSAIRRPHARRLPAQLN